MTVENATRTSATGSPCALIWVKSARYVICAKRLNVCRRDVRAKEPMNGDNMNMRDMPSRSTFSVRRCVAVVALLTATLIVAPSHAPAADDDAGKIVKAMTDYLAS